MAGTSARNSCASAAGAGTPVVANGSSGARTFASAPSDLACASAAANGTPPSAASRKLAALSASRAAVSAAPVLAISSRAALADCSSPAMRFCSASRSAGDRPAAAFFATSCRLTRNSVTAFFGRFGAVIGLRGGNGGVVAAAV